MRSKLPPEFIAYWVEDRSCFRPTTRMPRFFHTSNLEDDMAKRFQPEELRGIAHFLWARSEPFAYLEPAANYKPDSKRGKDLFSKARLPRLPQPYGLSRFARDVRSRVEPRALEDPAGATGGQFPLGV